MHIHNAGRKLAAATLTLLCLAFFACKKETKAPPAITTTTTTTTSTYDFSYTGSQFVAQPIHFISTAPGSSTFAWTFGDSSTASDATPTHAYTQAGSYTVKLVVNGDTAHTIIQSIGIGVDSTYLTMLSGTRNYHHKQYFSKSSPWDTTYYFADATITITSISPISIVAGNDTLVYYSSTDSTLSYFHTFYFSGTPYPTGSYNMLTFYHLTNKVTYNRFVHISAGASSNDIFDSF